MALALQCAQFHFEPRVTYFYYGKMSLITHNQTAPRPVWHFDVTRVTGVSQAEIENTVALQHPRQQCRVALSCGGASSYYYYYCPTLSGAPRTRAYPQA